jgi:hypothetical protein
MIRNVHVKMQSVRHHELDMGGETGPTVGQFIDQQVEAMASRGQYTNKVVVEFDPPTAETPNRCD